MSYTQRWIAEDSDSSRGGDRDNRSNRQGGSQGGSNS